MNTGCLVGGDHHENQIIIQKKCIILTSEIYNYGNLMKLCYSFLGIFWGGAICAILKKQLSIKIRMKYLHALLQDT